MKGRLAIIVILVIVCAGCAQRTIEGTWLPDQKLKPGSSVLIIPAKDGVERNGDIAAGSGSAFTSEIQNRLLLHGFPPGVAETLIISEALEEASDLGLTYVLKPEITEWEDNATEWSGKADRAALFLQLYDVEAKTVVATSQFRIKGNTFMLAPKDTNRFVAEVVDNALAPMFGWTPAEY